MTDEDPVRAIADSLARSGIAVAAPVVAGKEWWQEFLPWEPKSPHQVEVIVRALARGNKAKEAADRVRLAALAGVVAGWARR